MSGPWGVLAQPRLSAEAPVLSLELTPHDARAQTEPCRRATEESLAGTDITPETRGLSRQRRGPFDGRSASAGVSPALQRQTRHVALRQLGVHDVPIRCTYTARDDCHRRLPSRSVTLFRGEDVQDRLLNPTVKCRGIFLRERRARSLYIFLTTQTVHSLG